MEGDGLAASLSPHMDLGRKPTPAPAQSLTPRQRHSGERRRRAGERERRSSPQSAGPRRAGLPQQPPPARPQAYAARGQTDASDKTGSIPSQLDHSALAGRAKARPCAEPTGCRSEWCGGRGLVGPCGAAQAAGAASGAATAHPSTRNASHLQHGCAQCPAHPLQTRPSGLSLAATGEARPWPIRSGRGLRWARPAPSTEPATR